MLKNKYKTLTVNTIIFAIANIGARIISFILLPLYTNVLSTTEYGQAEIVVNCVNLVMPLISLSISDALLRFGLDTNENKENVLKTTCALLSISSVLCLALTPLFGVYSGIGKWNLVFSLINISHMFRGVLTLYTKVSDRNKVFACDTIVYAFSLAASNIVLLVYLKVGVSGYLISYIVANCASSLFIFFKIRIWESLQKGAFDKKLLKQMLSYSIPMIANATSWWIMQFSDRIMLNSFLSTSDVGIYAVAAKIPNILSTIVGVFTQAWMISSIVEYDNERDLKFYGNVFSSYLLVLSFASWGILIVLKPFMRVYVGQNFLESWHYVPYLLLAAFFGALSSFASPFYGAAKKNISVTMTTISAAIVNIMLNFLLIPQIGIMGAVIATLFAYFTIGIVRLFGARKYVPFDINVSAFWLTIILLAIQASAMVYYEDKIGKWIFVIHAIVGALLVLLNKRHIVRTIYLVTRRNNSNH